MSFIRVLFISVIISVMCAASAAAAERAPVAAFFRNPTISAVSLSPDGRSVAFKEFLPQQGSRLLVYDVKAESLSRVAHFTDADVGKIMWVGSDRLAYTVTNGAGPLTRSQLPGLVAVDVNGKHPYLLSQVVEPRLSFIDDPAFTDSNPEGGRVLGAVAPVTGELVAIENNPGQLSPYQLVAIDTRFGRRRSLGGPRHTRAWLLDQEYRLRAWEALADGKKTFGFRRDASSYTWMRPFTRSGKQPEDIWLAGAAGNQLYFNARQGGDTSALYAYDAVNDRLEAQPLVSVAGRDAGAALIVRQDKLLGVRTDTERKLTVWFDPAMQAIQNGIDEALPGAQNELSLAEVAPLQSTMVVASSSDVQPTRYFLYHPAKRELNHLGDQLDRFDPAQLGSRSLQHYTSRDGLRIPVYVTVPAGGSGKNLPLVVLVEPHPFKQASDWTFDRQAQFLASRGYAVLQPHPRGTAGYGKRHADAGKEQWGLGMQDDIADGVKWAVSQGLADAQRVCIAGTAYGGYAAMMGLARHPELYRCGISWSGITDIQTMLKDGGIAGTGAERIAGAKPDWERLKRVSPLHRAAHIRGPVLLAYGATDTGVPLARGRALYEAIRAHNQHAQWLGFDEDGRRAPYQDNRINFWTKVEAFLARHLAPRAPGGAPPSAPGRDETGQE